MSIRFTDEGIAFLQSLMKVGGSLQSMIADYPRVAEKVDRLTGGPGVKVNNPARGAITIESLSRTDQRVGGGQRNVTFKISSIVTSQIGRYNAKIVQEAADSTASGTLTEANIGTLPTADNAIVWHAPEIALASAKHMLKTGVVYTGRIVGATSAGLSIILCGMLPVGETASATTFSPSGTTADTATWSRAANGTPMAIDMTTRDYYDTSGHHLYYFTRLFTFDAIGYLYSVSAETRHTTDDAVSCS